MVQTCVVFGCKQEAYPGCGLPFHRLPTNESLREKWIEALNITRKTSKNTVVCGLHFQDEDYVTQAKKRLRQEAIPSIVCKLTVPWAKRSPSVESVSSSRAGSPSSADTGAEERSTGGRSPPLEYFRHHANEGSRCSLCHELFTGPRMVCLQCPTYLCIACSAASPHDHHYMLRVPAGRDQEEVDVLLHKLWDLIHNPSQATEDMETDATSIFIELLPESDPSTATEAGTQLVEYKQEAPGEEEETVLSCTTAALDPIDIDVKQDVEDDIEVTILNLLNYKSKTSSAFSKRKLVDDPQIPGHSRAKHLMIELPPRDQTVPGDNSNRVAGANSNILDNCDTKHRSSMKQQSTEVRLGRGCGKGAQLKNVTVMRDNISKHKAAEKTSRNTGIQGTSEYIHYKQNSGKDGGLR